MVKHKSWLSVITHQIRKPSCFDIFFLKTFPKTHIYTEEKPDLGIVERKAVNLQSNMVDKRDE